ncbi:hypothetical protein DPMN_054758 [Dreissena polymorpha]|uniref:Iodothyronine deiodinase n=1 Tax=Dreissena polymorpha TaxID=45954 RepID=A0A9D4CRC7_DREPO|nr:hypothetical protein DPMN_054758 [Dreissena polymorpha]
MAKLGTFNVIVDRFSHVADFLTVYVAEAHPLDEWALLNHEKYSRHQHTTVEERITAAKVLESEGIRGALVVDSLSNEGLEIYAALPERMYVLLDGVVRFRGGMGPMMYKPEEIEKWIEKHTKRAAVDV